MMELSQLGVLLRVPVSYTHLILAGWIRRRIEILEQRAMDHGEHIGYQRERARSQQLDDALAHEVGFALPRLSLIHI